MFEVLYTIVSVSLAALLVIAVGLPVVSFCEKVKKEMEQTEADENEEE